ncbi:hypothetical protein K438DRAFT_1963917 [Mycena galopus ATCC 62051]|nr:hypothetical protein K438DRAFT_1963917 [Mycena galopus ATCC 62051]
MAATGNCPETNRVRSPTPPLWAGRGDRVSTSLSPDIGTQDDRPVAAHKKHISLLDFLETPSLRRLVNYKTADVEEVFGLIARSNCTTSLTSFHFHSSFIHHSIISQVLRKMPPLTSLEFGDLNGTLASSSVPVFLRAVSNQWLAAIQETYPDCRFPGLHARIVDEQMNEKDADEVTDLLDARQKDGLFITVSSTTVFSDSIYEDFV